MVRRVCLLIPREGKSHSLSHPSLEALQPEWDVLNEIWHTNQEWQPYPIIHIKGHQDRGRHRIHELTLPAQRNIEADSLASQYLKHHPHPKREVHMFPHAHAHLGFGTNTVTYRYSFCLRNEEHDRFTIPYLKRSTSGSIKFSTALIGTSMVRLSDVNGSTCSTR